MAASLGVSASADAGAVELMRTMVGTHSLGRRWTDAARSVHLLAGRGQRGGRVRFSRGARYARGSR